MEAKLPKHALCSTQSQFAENCARIVSATSSYRNGEPTLVTPLVHSMDETYLNGFMQLKRNSDGEFKAYGNSFSFDKSQDQSIMCPKDALNVTGAPMVFAIVTKLCDHTDAFTSASWPWGHAGCSKESFNDVVGMLIGGGNMCPTGRTKDIATDCRPSWYSLESQSVEKIYMSKIL